MSNGVDMTWYNLMMWGWRKSFKFWISLRIFPTTSSDFIFCRLRILMATLCFVTTCSPILTFPNVPSKKTKFFIELRRKRWKISKNYFRAFDRACNVQFLSRVQLPSLTCFVRCSLMFPEVNFRIFFDGHKGKFKFSFFAFESMRFKKLWGSRLSFGYQKIETTQFES